jgi:hypothetical protein
MVRNLAKKGIRMPATIRDDHGRSWRYVEANKPKQSTAQESGYVEEQNVAIEDGFAAAVRKNKPHFMHMGAGTQDAMKRSVKPSGSNTGPGIAQPSGGTRR